MDIVSINFEEALTIEIKGQRISLQVFKTQESGNVKIGIEAPKTVRVNREEIQRMLNHAIRT